MQPIHGDWRRRWTAHSDQALRGTDIGPLKPPLHPTHIKYKTLKVGCFAGFFRIRTPIWNWVKFVSRNLAASAMKLLSNVGVIFHETVFFNTVNASRNDITSFRIIQTRHGMTSFRKRQNLNSDSQFNYSQIVIAAVHLSHKLNKVIKQVW